MISTSFLKESVLDSRRFGIRVVRGNIPADVGIDEIVNELSTVDADLVIFRTEAGDSTITTRLVRMGLPVIRAGTLVYYTIDLTRIRPQSPSHDDVRLATPADAAILRGIAAFAFRGYRSHYAANPLLPTDKILAGYVEWAQSRLSDDKSGSCTWVIDNEGRVAGFLSCDVVQDAGRVEIVLNAVHPKCMRRGLYTRLLQFVIEHYAQRGYRNLAVSTQLWNYTVQRQWIRAGLMLERAMDTYHIEHRLRRQQEPQP